MEPIYGPLDAGIAGDQPSAAVTKASTRSDSIDGSSVLEASASSQDVGINRFHAQLITEACHAAGLKVKLLLSDDSGYGNVEAHRLLLFARDLEQVAAIIEKTDSSGRA